MSNVIFVRTRHNYDSYVDFFNLAKWAGYPIIYADEMIAHDAKDVTFIISPTNGEWNNRLKSYTQGRVILWMLEWNIDGEHNVPDSVDEVWNSDRAHSIKNGFRYVPMGGDYRLNECPDLEPSKVYDVALLSYQTPRRQVITRQLQEQGLTIAPNSGLMGSMRSTVLQQAHVMVHTHQEETTRGIAPLRWCIAAAHSLPMITETVPDRGIFTYGHMVQAEYGYLAAFTAQMLQDKRLLADYAEALQTLLCRDYNFKVGVEKHV